MAKQVEKTKVAPYDSADYLNSEEDIAQYLEAFLADGLDHDSILHALGVVARARGMMGIAKATGMTRSGLYKALSEEGNPSFDTVLKIIKALGITLSAHAAKKAEQPKARKASFARRKKSASRPSARAA